MLSDDLTFSLGRYPVYAAMILLAATTEELE